MSGSHTTTVAEIADDVVEGRCSCGESWLGHEKWAVVLSMNKHTAGGVCAFCREREAVGCSEDWRPSCAACEVERLLP